MLIQAAGNVGRHLTKLSGFGGLHPKNKSCSGVLYEPPLGAAGGLFRSRAGGPGRKIRMARQGDWEMQRNAEMAS